LIDRVRIAADGRSADFLNIEGNKGSVNLLSDPRLLKILTDNGVDISAVPIDPTGDAFLSILQGIAFPLFFFGGLALINLARMR